MVARREQLPIVATGYPEPLPRLPSVAPTRPRPPKLIDVLAGRLPPLGLASNSLQSLVPSGLATKRLSRSPVEVVLSDATEVPGRLWRLLSPQRVVPIVYTRYCIPCRSLEPRIPAWHVNRQCCGQRV